LLAAVHGGKPLVKVLGIFLNNEMRTGGHIRCLELMEGLAQRGNQVTVLLNSVLSYKPRCFTEQRLVAPYRRKSIPPASLVFRRSIISWLDAGGPAETPDFVLVFGEVHLQAAMEIKTRLGVPILFGLQSNTVRETLNSIKENALLPHRLLPALFQLVHYRRYEGRIARSCAAVVFQSSFDRDEFLTRNRVVDGKLYVIPGNIGLPRFTEESRGLNRSDRVRKILFMGTLGERKGLRYLFQAFDILHSEERRDLELHVAGPGTAKQRSGFERYAEKRGFAGSVTFYGRVPSTFPLMAACDLLVAPSLFDSFPDVVLLALHVGIPVVGSRVGGIPDMLKHEDLLFPARDGPAIAAILRRCMDEPGRYAALRALSAERRGHFLFDWPARWEDVAAEAFCR
jgi:glycosyltransferase involved in cell wall biosynthesis